MALTRRDAAPLTTVGECLSAGQKSSQRQGGLILLEVTQVSLWFPKLTLGKGPTNGETAQFAGEAFFFTSEG